MKKTNTTLFINGCFDVLHAGHCKFLDFCIEIKKFYGIDHFIVGINSDEMIKKTKGNERPYFPAHERVGFLLEYCNSIDEVLIFNTETELANIIKDLHPIVVKGERWRGKMTGELFARRIIYAPDFYLPSTTLIEKRIKND